MATASAGVTGGRGLVLVFDLDQTLIDTTVIKSRRTKEQIAAAINPTILDIIDRAEQLSREKPGSIDAFLLLTNNDGRGYVTDICRIIAERFVLKRSNFRKISARENDDIDTTKPLFFDYIMMRSNQHRANMSKSLTDVSIMLSKLRIDYSDLDRRTFFFDDNEHPGMRVDMRTYPEHYIKIVSDVPNAGFLKGHPDMTDYSAVEAAFSRAAKGMEPVAARDPVTNHTGGPNGPPNSPPNSYNSLMGPGAYFIAPAPLPLKSAGPGATVPKYIAPPKATSTWAVSSGTNVSGLGLPKPKTRPSLMSAFIPPGGGKRSHRRSKTVKRRMNKKRSTRRRR
jgi:hypothetical protein